MTLHPQFVTDIKGQKKAVILPYKEYQSIIEDLDELNDIRLYDEGKKDKAPAIAIEKAFKQIEAKRKRK